MKAKKKSVLVVDDDLVDRRILEKILSDEYNVLQAGDGRQALEVLGQEHESIAGIILDLVMPIMSGYAFLEVVSADEVFSAIPVIVSTGDVGNEHELRALELGAWDFVAKPYDETILKFRLRNAIQRSQLSAFERLKYLTEFDSLTGIYSKSKFFTATREMLRDYPDESYVFIRFDIDRFQLINSFFGTDEGDCFLRFIAEELKRYLQPFEHCTYGRIESDVFAACVRWTSREQLYQIIASQSESIKDYNTTFDVVSIYGLYFLDDLSLPVATMLDRAALAAKTCKGHYAETVAEYVPAMSQRLEQDQEILNEMGTALEQRQFVVYYQPKYDLADNQVAGAEALIRWQHPEKGLVSPGMFVPVFEKNGFIATLDHYVWEEVCRQLRAWIDQGLDPRPVSVNMSRVNLHNPRIVDEVVGLVRKYDIDPQLLQLELTESAYMDNPRTMKRVIDGLRAAGFAVLMDDFGAGYSSLSVLKDIEVDVLKIDMRFLEQSEVEGRGESIIASVVRMAKWLGTPTIAEGAEQAHQVNFLRSVGCEYVQGFYFARPMPVQEYEQLMRDSNAVRKSLNAKDTLSSLWGDGSRLANLFAEGAQPACVFELSGDRTEIIRANEAFGAMLGAYATALTGHFLELIDPDSQEGVRDALQQATQQNKPVTCECCVRQADGEAGRCVRLRFEPLEIIGTMWVLLCGVQQLVSREGTMQE